jgi:hypothetical protein
LTIVGVASVPFVMAASVELLGARLLQFESTVKSPVPAAVQTVWADRWTADKKTKQVAGSENLIAGYIR